MIGILSSFAHVCVCHTSLVLAIQGSRKSCLAFALCVRDIDNRGGNINNVSGVAFSQPLGTLLPISSPRGR